MKTTRKEVEGVFKNWVYCFGGRIAENYNDVGAYRLDFNSVYGGYCIEHICNVHGGVDVVMHPRLPAGAFVSAMRLAIATMEQKRLAPVTCGDVARVLESR
jgi:hypothetical protein